MPTTQEVEQLNRHVSPEKQERLRDVEQLVLPLTELRRGRERVALICCARSALSQFNAALEPLLTLRRACDAIHSSQTLREVMLSALEIGNYINHGDRSKGAKAITIGSLVQLREFKLGRTSSLHFLCAQLASEASCDRGDAAGVLQRELQPVLEASRIQLQGLLAIIRFFGTELQRVANE